MATTPLDRVRELIEALPESDRAKLALELLRSLDRPPGARTAEAWAEELRRRVAEIETGTAKHIDREEFSRRVRERFPDS